MQNDKPRTRMKLYMFLISFFLEFYANILMKFLTEELSSTKRSVDLVEWTSGNPSRHGHLSCFQIYLQIGMTLYTGVASVEVIIAISRPFI